MSKMLQVRNVPDELHQTLKARAARAGMALSEYVLRELRELGRYPEQDDVFADAAEHGADVRLDAIVRVIRDDRDART